MHQLSSENCVTSARLISILLLEYERVDFLFFSPSTVWGLEKLPTAGISARRQREKIELEIAAKKQ